MGKQPVAYARGEQAATPPSPTPENFLWKNFLNKVVKTFRQYLQLTEGNKDICTILIVIALDMKHLHHYVKINVLIKFKL